MNRREFVVLAGACACSSVALGEEPKERRPPTSQPAPKPVDLGLLKQFDKDGVFDKWRQTSRFFVIRHEGKLYATTSRCAHKGGMLRLVEGELVCPMHGSRFDLKGIPTNGPAQVPLLRLAIKLTDKDHVIVDPSRQFSESDWEQADAFLEIK